MLESVDAYSARSGSSRVQLGGTQKDLEKIWAKAKARHPMQRVGSAMPAAAIICWAQTAIFMGNGK